MIFIETSIFTRQITELLSEESYAEFQRALILNPESGAVIKGSGGLRKARWSGSGRGKRGGIRVIYYFMVSNDKMLMLLAYPKNKKDDLTIDELKVLKRLVEDLKNG